MLKGLAICDLQPDGYRGVCRSNQLADYMTDAKIGGRVTDFLENFVDDESQEIRCTVAALPGRWWICLVAEARIAS